MLRLEYERKHLRISQKELAEKVGTTQPQISLFENGSRKPDYSTLCKLEDYFGLTHRELFSEI